MNPHQFEVTCGVCGEKGYGTLKTASAAWTDAEVFHANPLVCRENIVRQRNELQAKIRELEASV